MTISPSKKLLCSYTGTVCGLIDHINNIIFMEDSIIDGCPDSIAFGDSEGCEGCICPECVPEA